MTNEIRFISGEKIHKEGDLDHNYGPINTPSPRHTLSETLQQNTFMDETT